MIEVKKEQETAVLIGLIHREQDEAKITEYLDELAFLTETAGAQPLERFVQNWNNPTRRLLSVPVRSKRYGNTSRNTRWI